MNAVTERQKMLAGEPYDPQDALLVAERDRARRLCQELNAVPADRLDARLPPLAARLFGAETDVYITPPFFCDYGDNIRLGRKVYFNFNCVILDVAIVTIGDHVLFGPGAQVYTALHPLDASARRSGVESAQPVTIEDDAWILHARAGQTIGDLARKWDDDAWIGGGAIVCPGVRIGARSVIGAGSVVTRDIPPDVFAAGNPCRVIRPLNAATP